MNIAENLIRSNNWAIFGYNSSHLLIERNIIRRNTQGGIYCGEIYDDSFELIIGGSLINANHIIDNTWRTVWNRTEKEINAIYNYWGTTDEDEIAAMMINEGDGSIIFKPFISTLDESVGIELSFTKGINIISLPLQPESPYTASTLAEELAATIIIRSHEGDFQVYVPEGGYGLDFPIEVGKGYIVNLLKETQFSLTGRAWGTEVPAAPTGRHTGTAPTTDTWAFVVAGSLSGEIPKDVSILVTNHRTGQSTVADIDPSRQFTAAFVDMTKRGVVAVGDEISLQVLDSRGNPIGQPKRHHITPAQLSRAYLLSTLSIRPTQTQLLPNYPNPFNPETWIPYQLASDLPVTISIYNTKGRLIRTVALGYRPAGMYLSKNRAAYWDASNQADEPVASGIYFYTLQAGDFRATRRMTIMK